MTAGGTVDDMGGYLGRLEPAGSAPGSRALRVLRVSGRHPSVVGSGRLRDESS